MEGSVCSCDGDTMQDELYSIHQSSAWLLLAQLIKIHEGLFILLIFVIVKLNKPQFLFMLLKTFGYNGDCVIS